MSNVRADTGLGTLYERHAIYERVRAWCDGRAIASALEGPIDGMAGMAGLHLLPAARRGTRVTVAVRDPGAAVIVRTVYARAGLSDRLEIVETAQVPQARSFDLVFSHAALHLASDWREYLRQLARSCARYLVVTVANRRGWGVRLHSLLGALGDGGGSPAPYVHEATDPLILEKELRSIGRVLERAWLDCPWWPDLFVQPGTTLVRDLARRAGLPFPPAARWVHDAESFRFAQDAAPPELARALRRHPVFDERQRWARPFAHHVAYLVERAAV
ncbi:MAG: methyltransferase domain-containing protein [Deltaproteobacteria bacterium]|nr:methyltransferase domain-containing protein [Deltaproteobacteria bacterium]